MAIDPSIALQFNNPTMQNSPMAGYTQGIENAARMTNTAAQTAQIPGIQAQSSMQQRQNAGQQWLQDNSDKFTTTNPDGTKSFDSAGASTELATAGFPEMASQLAAHYLNNEVLKTSSASGRIDMVNKLGTTIAGIAGSMPDGPGRDTAIQKYIDALDGAGYVPGTTAKMGSSMASQLWAYDKNGQPITNPDGSHVLNDLAVNGMRMSTVPVSTQEDIAQWRLANHTGPDSLSPGSGVSRATNSLAQKLGFAKAGDPPQSDFYWSQRPDFQSALKNNAPSQSFVEQQKAKVMQYGEQSQILDAAINAANAARLPTAWQPGVALNSWMSDKTNSPGYGAFISALNAAKSIDPTIDETKQDGPTILGKLQALRERSGKLTDFYGGATTTGPSPTPLTGTPSGTISSGMQGAGGMAPVAPAAANAPADTSQAPGAPAALSTSTVTPAPAKQVSRQSSNAQPTANHSGKTATEQDVQALMTKFKLSRDQVVAKLTAAGVKAPGQ